MISRSLLWLTLLLAGCSLSLGVGPQPTTLRLQFSGPTLNGGSGRLVVPGSVDGVDLQVVQGGRVVSQATASWNSDLSANALVTGVPVGVALTLNASAYSMNGTEKVVTATGTANFTLTVGANTVQLFLFPEAAFVSGQLDVGTVLNEQELLPGYSDVYQFNVTAATSTLTIITPPSLTVYLQDPSGPSQPVFTSPFTVTASPGVWHLLLWNQGNDPSSGDLGVQADTNPVQYGYTLADLTFEIGGETINLELRLWDRPHTAGTTAQQLQVRPVSNVGPGVIQISDLNWFVGPQSELRGVNLENPTDQVVFYDLSPPTVPGQVRHLFAYGAPNSQSVQASRHAGARGARGARAVAPPEGGVNYGSLYMLETALPSPTNVAVDTATGRVTWDPVPSGAGYTLTGYNVYDTFTGGIDVGPSSTKADLVLPTGESTVFVVPMFTVGEVSVFGYSASKDISVEDNVAPTVSVQNPVEGAQYKDDAILVSGTITDNSSLSPSIFPEYSWDGDAYAPVSTWDGATFTLNLSNFQSQNNFKSHILIVRLADGSGNWGTKTLTFSTAADDTAPVVVVQTPQNTLDNLSRSNSSFDITGIIQEQGGYGYPTVSTNWGTTGVSINHSFVTGSWSVTIDSSNFPSTSGPYIVTVTVTNFQSMTTSQDIDINFID